MYPISAPSCTQTNKQCQNNIPQTLLWDNQTHCQLYMLTGHVFTMRIMRALCISQLTEIMVNILFRCSVLPINTSGITKHNNDISSSRLFCRGVPVNNNLLSAYKQIYKIVIPFTRIYYNFCLISHLLIYLREHTTIVVLIS